MSSIPLRSSDEGTSSIRSSISDIHVLTPSTTLLQRSDELTRLRHSNSLESPPGSIDEDGLDREDPLSRVYVRDDEFERFSKKEMGFITVSCLGVVAVPLLYLLVTRLRVRKQHVTR